MVGDKRVLWPQAEAFDRPKRPVTGEGLTDLQSKTVAFVDNGRPNADVVMESLNDLMISKYEIKPMTVSKRHLGMRNNEPLPKALFDDLLKRVDAAVTGLGS